LDDGAVHAFGCLIGEPYGDINKTGSSQPVEILGFDKAPAMQPT
jgi:hypothetical protein